MYRGSFVDYTEHWHTAITVQLEGTKNRNSCIEVHLLITQNTGTL